MSVGGARTGVDGRSNMGNWRVGTVPATISARCHFAGAREKLDRRSRRLDAGERRATGVRGLSWSLLPG